MGLAHAGKAVRDHLMGYKVPPSNVKEYIESYSIKELMGNLSRIERVVNYKVEMTITQSRGRL